MVVARFVPGRIKPAMKRMMLSQDGVYFAGQTILLDPGVRRTAKSVCCGLQAGLHTPARHAQNRFAALPGTIGSVQSLDVAGYCANFLVGHAGSENLHHLFRVFIDPLALGKTM